MTTIKASNVWDDDYMEPSEADKLRGECAQIYMEKRDIEWKLQDIKYRQVRARRIYAVCVIIAAVLFLIPIFIGALDLFYHVRPVTDFHMWISGYFLLAVVLLGGISSVIFFSAMSVNSFWANCANFLRIDKLEVQRLGYIREKSALEVRLEELEAEISGKEAQDSK